jgi:hypothetical protein
MLIIRCLRPDRITHCVLNFVIHNIGSKFVEPPILQLNTILEDSNKRSPIIFILSPGIDPAAKLQQLAEDKMMAQSRYYTLSLGQGQAPIARKLLEAGIKKVIRREERELLFYSYRVIGYFLQIVIYRLVGYRSWTRLLNNYKQLLFIMIFVCG